MLLNLVLKKTLESPLGYKKIKPVNPKGSQPLIFIRSTVAEAEASTLWPLDVIGKYLDERLKTSILRPLDVKNRPIGKYLDDWKTP